MDKESASMGSMDKGSMDSMGSMDKGSMDKEWDSMVAIIKIKV
jgi:hypothetical protein